jgi:CRP-like cAMP-binding protein
MITITAEHQQALRQNPLFKALSDEQFAQLLQDVTLRRIEQGQYLFEAGAEASAFYLLHRGQVKLYRLSPTGQEKVIEIVRPGETFAEALMFLDIPAYPVSAQALSDSELFVIRSKTFIHLLAESVETGFYVMAHISMRLRALLNDIDALTLQNASLRLVNYLLFLAGEVEAEDDSTELTLPAAKNIVASRLSIQPETLSRILGNLSGKGLISVDGLNIKVLDMEGLRRFGG